jgi:hypothetical protein
MEDVRRRRRSRKPVSRAAAGLRARRWPASLVAIAVVTGCAGHSEPGKVDALKACNIWASAGIGDVQTTPSNRKANIARARSAAESAARSSSSWNSLNHGLIVLDDAEAARHYDATIGPDGRSNFDALVTACQRAGQRP